MSNSEGDGGGMFYHSVVLNPFSSFSLFTKCWNVLPPFKGCLSRRFPNNMPISYNTENPGGQRLPFFKLYRIILNRLIFLGYHNFSAVDDDGHAGNGFEKFDVNSTPL